MHKIAKTIVVALLTLLMFSAESMAQQNSVSGCVQVYDAIGQYLGVLIERGRLQDEVVVFIPGLNKFASIKQTTGDIESTNLTFEANGCAGTAYFAGGVDFIRKCNGKYYVGGTEAKNILRVSTELASGECLRWAPVYDKLADMFAATEIPESLLPFTLPVNLPLRYECP